MEFIQSKGRSTHFLLISHINVQFFRMSFFGIYWGINFATRRNRAKGVKPLLSHQDFVQLFLPIRKK